MGGDSAELALKQFKVLDGTLISCESKIVPEFSDLFIQEADVTLNEASLKGTEDQVVGRDALGLKRE